MSESTEQEIKRLRERIDFLENKKHLQNILDERKKHNFPISSIDGVSWCGSMVRFYFYDGPSSNCGNVKEAMFGSSITNKIFKIIEQELADYDRNR